MRENQAGGELFEMLFILREKSGGYIYNKGYSPCLAVSGCVPMSHTDSFIFGMVLEGWCGLWRRGVFVEVRHEEVDGKGGGDGGAAFSGADG